MRRLGAKIESPTSSFGVPWSGRNAELRKRAVSPLGDIYFERRGRPVIKWVDYLDLYDRHFSRFRGTSVRLLEIGIQGGGSLELWREYLGSDATIMGIDINPQCLNFVDPPNKVRIGSQDDPSFLTSVVKEMGEIDIVVDDGSHIGRHQNASLEILFPLLKDGGIYCMEDLHTSYFPGEWEGGFKRPGTAIESVKSVIDDMHGWFHKKKESFVPRESVLGVHAYESIVFIDKGLKHRPVTFY